MERNGAAFIWAAEKDHDKTLSFADKFTEASGADVLMAQGSLQYLPETLSQKLNQLATLPRHLLLNLLGLLNLAEFFQS